MEGNILLYRDLSFTLRGILYKTHEYLGRFRSEKQYGDAIEQGLKVKKIKYEREKILSRSFIGEKSGRNRLDFLVEDLIILEIKVVPFVDYKMYRQCARYLVSSNKELCLLVNFYPENLFIKRILNPEKV